MDATTQVSAASLAALVEGLATLPRAGSDRDLVDLIGALEDVKNACCAAQAHATVALRQLREDAAPTPHARELAARSVVGEVALARRESPHRARTLVGLAQVLTTELPHTLHALQTGGISEWTAILVARETACLSRPDRLTVDAHLAPGLTRWSIRETVAHARAAAYTADPHAVVDSAARAEGDRRVSIRPAPDCMTRISALLPVAQGVATYAALVRAADAARATGDPRGRGQVMADTLVERVTGQDTAPAVPVEIQLVLTDQTLLAHGDTPAHVAGYGQIPPTVARQILAPTTDPPAARWVRRLYARPDGRLIAMESTRRLFPPGLARFIATRDAGTCRTPWCDAPIAHIDHVTPHHRGGPTAAANGQGLCAQCNQIKEAPGWHSHPGPDGTITLHTPTGHTHISRPPPLPHEDPPRRTPTRPHTRPRLRTGPTSERRSPPTRRRQ